MTTTWRPAGSSCADSSGGTATTLDERTCGRLAVVLGVEEEELRRQQVEVVHTSDQGVTESHARGSGGSVVVARTAEAGRRRLVLRRVAHVSLVRQLRD